MSKLLYSRAAAAELLSISVATLDVSIARGMLKVMRKGRRVLIEPAELEKFSRRDTPQIWPAKDNGKTVRTFEAHA